MNEGALVIPKSLGDCVFSFPHAGRGEATVPNPHFVRRERFTDNRRVVGIGGRRRCARFLCAERKNLHSAISNLGAVAIDGPLIRAPSPVGPCRLTTG
jgi:hypothetical protein